MKEMEINIDDIFYSKYESYFYDTEGIAQYIRVKEKFIINNISKNRYTWRYSIRNIKRGYCVLFDKDTLYECFINLSDQRRKKLEKINDERTNIK